MYKIHLYLYFILININVMFIACMLKNLKLNYKVYVIITIFFTHIDIC